MGHRKGGKKRLSVKIQISFQNPIKFNSENIALRITSKNKATALS